MKDLERRRDKQFKSRLTQCSLLVAIALYSGKVEGMVVSKIGNNKKVYIDLYKIITYNNLVYKPTMNLSIKKH